MRQQTRGSVSLFAALFVAFVLGCGSGSTSSVSAPPPPLSAEELAEEEKRNKENYAQPSEADRLNSSN